MYPNFWVIILKTKKEKVEKKKYLIPFFSTFLFHFPHIFSPFVFPEEI